MKTKSAALLLFYCFLAIQLLMVNPAIYVPKNFTFGSFDVVGEKDAELSRQQLNTSIYSDSTTDVYQSLVLVGDIMIARNVEFLMRTNSHSYPFEGIHLKSFAPTAAIIGNFEAAVPSIHVPTKANELQFSVAKEFLPTLREVGFTHLSLGNNHSFDYGQTGYENTVEQLNTNSLSTFGHQFTIDSSAISYIQTPRKRVALIGLNVVNNKSDYSELVQSVARATRDSEWQVVYIHWGEEYKSLSNNSQRVLAERLIEAGADLIVGHHPHVVQNIELIKGVPVFYSLGNYIFDQYFSKEVQEGLLLSVVFEEDVHIYLLPVSSLAQLSQPRIMESQPALQFLDALAAISDPLLSAQIQSGKLVLPSTVASSTKVAIIK